MQQVFRKSIKIVTQDHQLSGYIDATWYHDTM